MAPITRWSMKGRGYEFCNCDFGCGCNFAGFPNSDDGSCRAVVGLDIATGVCGKVKLSGVKCAAIVHWPKAIHEGGGKCVFVVDPATTDEQVDALAQICTGKLGGLPWELLGPTFEVIGLEKAKISIEGSGLKSVFRAQGLIEAHGDTFKNPVTGEEHLAEVVLPSGFIWTRGQCGQGSFHAKSGGLALDFDKTNWILYDFDWSNAEAKAA
ncbi:MAG TPA: DUF1326 domain-containing protein [Gammaproteobacteria bacterium]|nr:DUF1326 domain-containing protein [Gammaproteobacteria bacterium]